MVMQSSVQRSVRLSARTSALLDELADLTGETRNSLVERLLAEGLRRESHPLVGFRTGAAGRREPFLIGTRLLVREAVAQVRSSGSPAAAADYLGVDPALISAATDYYADFRDEIDADLAWAGRAEAAERERWERRQRASV